MRTSQVLKVFSQLCNAFLGVGLFQHMFAHEGIQSADVFNRDNLVEQVEGFLGTQTHQMAKAPVVLREFVKHCSTPGSQLLKQTRNLAAYRDMRLDVQSSRRN